MRLERRKLAFPSGGDVHFRGNKTPTPTQGKDSSLASIVLWPLLASRCCCSLVPLSLLWRWGKFRNLARKLHFAGFDYSLRFIAALDHGGKSSKEQQWRLNCSFLPLPE
jgi:hypothetical protein